MNNQSNSTANMITTSVIECGEIHRGFNCAFESLPAIMTLIETSRLDRATYTRIIQTDRDGLQKLAGTITEASAYVAIHTNTIGELLSIAAPEEVKEHIVDIGWLLRDLSALAKYLNEAGSLVLENIKITDETAAAA